MSKSLNVKEAAKALREGKVVNSANAGATIKFEKSEGQERVIITKKVGDGDDVMNMTLSRMEQVYSNHTFALGQYAIPAEKKPAAPTDTK